MAVVPSDCEFDAFAKVHASTVIMASTERLLDFEDRVSNILDTVDMIRATSTSQEDMTLLTYVFKDRLPVESWNEWLRSRGIDPCRYDVRRRSRDGCVLLYPVGVPSPRERCGACMVPIVGGRYADGAPCTSTE